MGANSVKRDQKDRSQNRTVICDNGQLLDPVSRISEILFGLIMVLTFTCSLSVAQVARDDVRLMLFAAMGCNLAWGVIDALFYLMGIAGERGRERVLLSHLKSTIDADITQELLKGLLPASIAEGLSEKSFLELRSHFVSSEPGPRRWLLEIGDLKAAVLVFALVFCTIFPVAVPFLLMNEVDAAIRVSNAIALILLFGCGFHLGRYAGSSAWLWGLSVMALGAVMVGMTIALGG